MKGAVLGANCSLCAELICQAVVPATGLPSASAQLKAAPPHAWTSIPRCRLYQACSAGASLALKKMPPMPVTRFIEPPRSGGGLPNHPSAAPSQRLLRRPPEGQERVVAAEMARRLDALAVRPMSAERSQS